jgi:hypothetical protein
MREIMDWIDREVERLDREVKGEADAAKPEQVPDALRTVLGDCVDKHYPNMLPSVHILP